MEFKGTKGRLNITDNGNGQMAIYGEDLKCIAFIPKLHEESREYSNLFKCAPEMLGMLKELLLQFEKVEKLYSKDSEAIEKAKNLIEKATNI